MFCLFHQRENPIPIALQVFDKFHGLKSDDRQRDHSDVGKSNVSEASDDHLSLAVGKSSSK